MLRVVMGVIVRGVDISIRKRTAKGQVGTGSHGGAVVVVISQKLRFILKGPISPCQKPPHFKGLIKKFLMG
jgi:hypothetical protein